MKHKCAVRDCQEHATLVWDKGIAYFCDKHFLEHLKLEKERCGVK
jgi:hypothetical protein